MERDPDAAGGATVPGGGRRPQDDVVGRVLGTEDATPLAFWVAVAPGQYLQIDDVVATARVLPDGSAVSLSGVVAQVRARHEGARFDSDVFLIEDGVLPAEVAEAAQVLVTRAEPEVFVPPRPGTPVARVRGEARDRALYFDEMRRRLPAGLLRDGLPMYVDVDFLDGTRGAHVNISGVSGVATKTSYATFLLHGLFTSGQLGGLEANTKALVFNVKGEDLLFLDRPNTRLSDAERRRYDVLGLPARPFDSVALFAPPRPGDPDAGPDVSARRVGVASFWWTPREVCEEELLPFAFADVEDERQQYTMVVHNVTAHLKHGKPFGDDGAWEIDDERVRTWAALVDLIEAHAEEDRWVGKGMGAGTVNAFLRRLRSSVRALSPLVRADVPDRPSRRIQTADSRVTVVDLHNLSDRAKRFVVGVTLRRSLQDKEQSGSRLPLLFVVLDELNKYAPREGTSPIKEILLDVAERGRSLGVILIGAQQTASEVERRIVANCALRVTGRLDAAEAARPEYGYLPPAHVSRAIIARPGTMFLSQPRLPVPLCIQFPFPAWATTPEEAPPAGDGADPFAGLPRRRGARRG